MAARDIHDPDTRNWAAPWVTMRAFMLAMAGAQLTESELRVLLCVIARANPVDGKTFASRLTIATESGCDPATVRKTITRLAAGGWITVERGGGRGRLTVYQVAWTRGGRVLPKAGERPAERRLKGGVSAPVSNRKGGERASQSLPAAASKREAKRTGKGGEEAPEREAAPSTCKGFDVERMGWEGSAAAGASAARRRPPYVELVVRTFIAMAAYSKMTPVGRDRLYDVLEPAFAHIADRMFGFCARLARQDLGRAETVARHYAVRLSDTTQEMLGATKDDGDWFFDALMRAVWPRVESELLSAWRDDGQPIPVSADTLDGLPPELQDIARRAAAGSPSVH